MERGFLDLDASSLSAISISEGVRSGALDPLSVSEFYISRTLRYAKRLNTHLFFDPDDVRKQVQNLRENLKTGKYLPLAGVPILIKDNICVKGMKTTCGSNILRNYRAPYSATVIEKLVNAGGILFGKANLDEFGMGSSSEFSAFGSVSNPWNECYVPGGSSGGSSAAVAACLAPVALGSDTGGSIRQPASFCGIVGLKPTYGRVSRYGLIAYASSLDQIGPLTRSVEDSALLLDVISGYDELDSTSLKLPPTNTLETLRSKDGLKGIRIGLVKEFFDEGLDPGVRDVLDEAVGTLKELGANIQEISIPYIKYSVASYYLIATAEASANLARFDGVRYGSRETQGVQNLFDLYSLTRSVGFGREVKKRIMLGTYALSAGHYENYYARATRARALLRYDFDKAFEKVDLLIAPTTPTEAFEVGSKIENPLAMYLGDICTIAANLVGVPAISLPCGLSGKKLPVGIQFMAASGKEAQLLKGSLRYEQACRFNSKYKVPEFL